MQRYGDVMANINKTFFDQQLSLTATIGASIEDLKYRATLLGGDLTSVANLFTLSNMTATRPVRRRPTTIRPSRYSPPFSWASATWSSSI